MLLLNDLFTFKPLDTKEFNIDKEDSEILNLLMNTSDSRYYDYGLHFVYKYYINKFPFPINKKLECINILKDNFLKNPKWYTYDILKYLILDLDFKLLLEIFNKENVLSLFIGEYLMRNSSSDEYLMRYFSNNPEDLKFSFYIAIPFYLYNKKIPKFGNIFDLNIIFLFPDLINSDYEIQYYLLNYKEFYQIDNFIIKINQRSNFESDNPFTNFLLSKNNMNYKKSKELMILNYKYSINIKDTVNSKDIDKVTENNIYNEIIKKYHNLDYKLLEGDINHNIYEDIINEFCLIDHTTFKSDFKSLCKEYEFSLLILKKDIWSIEDILNLEESLFNTFITSKKEYKYHYKGKEIEKDIMKLIKEYHTSKLMTKKFRENLYNKIMEHEYKEIFEIYLKRSSFKKEVNINKDINKEVGKEEKQKEKEANINKEEKQKEKEANINNNIVLKRYKLNIPKKIDTNIINIELNTRSCKLRKYLRKPTYKKVIKKHLIFYEYINIKYKSTNYKFIKYLSEERAKEEISDLIKHNLRMLNKITKKYHKLDSLYKLEEYEYLELIERLKKEGDKKKVDLIFNIINRFNYKVDILTYESLDFTGRNKLLKIVKIDNKSDFIKLIIILNNEDNLRLVIKILNIIKDNKKYLDIIEKYKKNSKFNRVIIRVYPFINKEDEYYKEIRDNYKYKEEIDLLSRYYQI